MQELNFAVRKQKIYCESERGVIEKSQGLVYASFEFDDEWDGCSIAVIFSNENFEGNPRVVIWTGEPILIPKELLVQGRLKVSCEGKREGYSIPTYEMIPGIMVYASGELIGVVPDDIEPSMVEQLMAAAAEARSAAEEIRTAKAAGEFKGERGDPGLTMEYDEETETLIIDIAPSTGSSGSDGDGEDSETGTNTVGITSIEQTVTSEEDGGINEIKATMSDGATSVFRIRNGSKGSAGDSFVSLTYNSNTGKWVQKINSGGNLIETEVDGPEVYSKEEIETMFGSYIDEVAAKIGGGA